jgi:hypothetical protein
MTVIKYGIWRRSNFGRSTDVQLDWRRGSRKIKRNFLSKELVGYKMIPIVITQHRAKHHLVHGLGQAQTIVESSKTTALWPSEPRTVVLHGTTVQKPWSYWPVFWVKVGYKIINTIATNPITPSFRDCRRGLQQQRLWALRSRYNRCSYLLSSWPNRPSVSRCPSPATV